MLSEMPQPDKNGFVRTMNNTGYMTTYVDEISEAWTKAAQNSYLPSADIGAAYGVATLKALEGLNSHVIAIDLDAQHLEILKSRARFLKIEKRLTCLRGDFPSDINLENKSLSNVLICRVLHFFDGIKLKESILWCYEKLAHGGKLFLVNETPYLRNFQSFIPIYEKRRAEGAEFPGFIDDVPSIASERSPFLPKQMHLLDADVLSRVCKETGFEIERTVNIPRPNFPPDIQLDGRESVGVIARKG